VALSSFTQADTIYLPGLGENEVIHSVHSKDSTQSNFAFPVLEISIDPTHEFKVNFKMYTPSSIFEIDMGEAPIDPVVFVNE
jgi:hypothetical protein